MREQFPSTEFAEVWRYGHRRYFTKRAAYRAWARDVMRGDEHEDVDLSDFLETGERCYCDHCTADEAAEAAMTTHLMKHGAPPNTTTPTRGSDE